MNNIRREKEEYLERMWEMKEQGLKAEEDLRDGFAETYDSTLVDELVLEGLVESNGKDKEIVLTQQGEDRAREIIRAHRIGERLIYDVFGGEFEKAACEFEHTLSTELVDGICTLLGHPRECPHGMPIPEGECCRSYARTTHNLVAPLTELAVGQSARIAYINSRDDRRMHRLNGLQIRPGSVVKLHQQYPCYVVECEGAQIAMDEEIVSCIRVWYHDKSNNEPGAPPDQMEKKSGSWWRTGLRRGRKRQGGQ